MSSRQLLTSFWRHHGRLLWFQAHPSRPSPRSNGGAVPYPASSNPANPAGPHVPPSWAGRRRCQCNSEREGSHLGPRLSRLALFFSQSSPPQERDDGCVGIEKRSMRSPCFFACKVNRWSATPSQRFVHTLLTQTHTPPETELPLLFLYFLLLGAT